MNIINTQGTNEQSFNKKSNTKIKYSLNTLRKKNNNFYQNTISSDKNLKNRHQIINNLYYF